jgi:hypothetical protein
MTQEPQQQRGGRERTNDPHPQGMRPNHDPPIAKLKSDTIANGSKLKHAQMVSNGTALCQGDNLD